MDVILALPLEICQLVLARTLSRAVRCHLQGAVFYFVNYGLLQPHPDVGRPD